MIHTVILARTIPEAEEVGLHLRLRHDEYVSLAPQARSRARGRTGGSVQRVVLVGDIQPAPWFRAELDALLATNINDVAFYRWQSI